MKFIFTPKVKNRETEKELIYESESPLRQDNENWFVIDKEGVGHTIKKGAYTIRVEQ